MAKAVTIQVLQVGQQFGFCATIRDAATGRKVRVTTCGQRHHIETDAVPFREAAIARATRLAEARGWEVVS